MSYQDFASELVDQNHIDGAVIFSRQDGHRLASAGNDFVTIDEIRNMKDVLVNSGKKAADNFELQIGGEQYGVLKCDDNSVYCRNMTNGVYVGRNGELLIAVHHDAVTDGSAVMDHVDRVVDKMY